jgi:hypothetical protein
MKKTVPCPRCGRPAVFSAENPWRPFCGERCKTIDLGAWASESYRVPVQDEPAEDDPSSSSP